MNMGISFDYYQDNMLKTHVDRIQASYDSKSKILKYKYKDVENIIEMNEEVIFTRLSPEYKFQLNLTKKHSYLELQGYPSVDISVLFVNFKKEPSKITLEYQLESNDEGRIKLIIIPEETLI